MYISATPTSIKKKQLSIPSLGKTYSLLLLALAVVPKCRPLIRHRIWYKTLRTWWSKELRPRSVRPHFDRVGAARGAVVVLDLLRRIFSFFVSDAGVFDSIVSAVLRGLAQSVFLDIGIINVNIIKKLAIPITRFLDNRSEIH